MQVHNLLGLWDACPFPWQHLGLSSAPWPGPIARTAAKEHLPLSHSFPSTLFKCSRLLPLPHLQAPIFFSAFRAWSKIEMGMARWAQHSLQAFSSITICSLSFSTVLLPLSLLRQGTWVSGPQRPWRPWLAAGLQFYRFSRTCFCSVACSLQFTSLELSSIFCPCFPLLSHSPPLSAH